VNVLIAAKCNLEKPNQNGHTPLYCAVEMEDLRLIECLLKAGASKQTLSKNGISPLQLATEKK